MTTTLRSLDPSLDRALDLIDSPAARDALAALLADRTVGGRLVRGGHLMSEGYPVELTFTSASPTTVRWTADVVPPACPPSARLRQALSRLTANGVQVPASRVLTFLAGEQQGHEVRFGAWVGGRHDASGDRYKLYVDVPRNRPDRVGKGLRRLLGRSLRRLDGTPLRFVGLDLRDGTVEMYHRIGPSDRQDIEAVLAAEGLAHRTGDLLDALAAATRWPVVDRLPVTNLGASVAVGPRGDTTVALFAHTVSVLGRDLGCRERLLRLVADRGLDLGRYAEVSAALADAPPARRHHSMLTLAVADGGPVHLGIGLRPPDPSPIERRQP